MSPILDKDWNVEQVLESYPQIAGIFIRLKTDCVGCRLDWFCTLEDVAREYGLILDDFLAVFEEAVTGIYPKES